MSNPRYSCLGRAWLDVCVVTKCYLKKHAGRHITKIVIYKDFIQLCLLNFYRVLIDTIRTYAACGAKFVAGYNNNIKSMNLG